MSASSLLSGVSGLARVASGAGGAVRGALMAGGATLLDDLAGGLREGEVPWEYTAAAPAAEAPTGSPHRRRRRKKKKADGTLELEGSDADEEPPKGSLADRLAPAPAEDHEHVSRQLYREKYGIAQVEIASLRAELERVKRAAKEDLSGEKARREKDAKEARREASRLEESRDSLEAELAKSRAQTAELQAASTAQERTLAALREELAEAVRVSAKQRSALQAADERAAALEGEVGAGVRREGELKRDLAALRLHVGALRKALRTRVSRARADGQSAAEEHLRLTSELGTEQAHGAEAWSRTMEMQAQIARLEAEGARLGGELEAREAALLAEQVRARRRARTCTACTRMMMCTLSRVLHVHVYGMLAEQVLGAKLAEQLRDAREEAVRALQAGMEGERDRTRSELAET